MSFDIINVWYVINPHCFWKSVLHLRRPSAYLPVTFIQLVSVTISYKLCTVASFKSCVYSYNTHLKFYILQNQVQALANLHFCCDPFNMCAFLINKCKGWEGTFIFCNYLVFCSRYCHILKIWKIWGESKVPGLSDICDVSLHK